jgi:hypothetical protein
MVNTDQHVTRLGLPADLWASFDDFAVLESCAGSDQRDEVGCVHSAPPAVCGLDEHEGHRDPGAAGAGPIRDPLSEPDGGEGGFSVNATNPSRQTRQFCAQLGDTEGGDGPGAPAPAAEQPYFVAKSEFFNRPLPA